jgi:hypothetical protein
MNFVFADPVKQKCFRCTGWFDQEAFFRKKSDKRELHISSLRHPVCIGCEITARTEDKKKDPWLEKARSTIQRHARKYKKTTKEFIRLYGWDTIRIAHILKHAFDNTCPYCREAYAGMPNSQWQVSVDIIDPTKPPFLETNTQPCCQTCNREKSDMPPELWARRLRCWAEYEAWQKTRSPQPIQISMHELFGS